MPLPCSHQHHRCILVLFLAASAISAAAQSAKIPTDTFHSEVHLVNITFTVRSGNQLVRGLTADDFDVYEDGVPQKIAAFSHDVQLPLTLGLLIDVSSSQDKFLKQHNRDIQNFLEHVLQPSDQAFAICFGNHLRLVSDTTSSPSQIMDGLQRYDHSNSSKSFPELAPDPTREGGTALFDAVVAGIREKMGGEANRRRALILFTDGEENASANDLLDAIGAAQDSDVLVYAVRYTQTEHGKLTAHNHNGIHTLAHLTAQTGGADYDGLRMNLNDAFDQIAAELRSLYVLSYHSTNKQHEGGFRKVHIEAKQPGFVVRAKSGYYAR